jgi:hypothetical protein
MTEVSSSAGAHVHRDPTLQSCPSLGRLRLIGARTSSTLANSALELGFSLAHDSAPRDQVEDYAARKGWTIAEAEKWLAPVLNYDPLVAALTAAE